MFVQILINIPQVKGLYDYHVPEQFHGKIQKGCLVVVPFGRQLVQGIVVRKVPQPQVQETRPIEAVLDPEPVVTDYQIQLARKLGEINLSSGTPFLSQMIPPGLKKQADTLFELLVSLEEFPDALSPLQKRLLEHLHKKGRKKGLRGRQFEHSFRNTNWRTSMRALVKRNLVSARPILPPPSVAPKLIKTVQLSASPEEVAAIFDKVGMKTTIERRQKILNFLLQEPWPVETAWVYAVSGGNMQDLKKLAEMGLVALQESETLRDPLENMEWVHQEEPQLTPGQIEAWEPLQAALHSDAVRKPFVLFGVTGSGKTEIYMQAVKTVLSQGKQALILVPEIALTPQTVKRFMARFPGQVGLIHSKLSEGERYDTWRRIRSGQLSVIIGPRSALFSPLPDPGLIVLDECHDDSYYQAELTPTYDAREAAIQLGKLTNAAVVLGSATPPISLLYRAERLEWPILRLPQRIMAHKEAVSQQMRSLGVDYQLQTDHLELPPVEVVDMRQELKAGNTSIFSRQLLDALEDVLAANQQAILFLNRRGSATYVFCRDCGYTLRCPRCDIPLTWHESAQGQGRLICHTCNYARQMPRKCPQCGSQRIRQMGTGTERVESELLKVFPNARVLRWDASAASKKGSHEIILSHFVNHRADILIGTQMLAKGLDMPLVTLVGVVLADVGLNLPDYRAGERGFQLLTQVAGRAGRSPLGGRVILQSFDPEHYAVQAASRHGYQEFYETELEYRRQTNYPPFSRLVKLEFKHQNPRQAKETAQKMAEQVQFWLDSVGAKATRMIGPVPCFFSRQHGYYRWQIILSGPDPAAVLNGKPLGEWQVEINPPSLL